MLQRELESYENPLPSREYILQIVTEQGVPLSFERLVKLLDIRPEEEEFFMRRLRRHGARWPIDAEPWQQLAVT